MTPEEEEKFWELYTLFIRNREYRKGQALMNALGRVAPILYDMISQTPADSFYRDDNIPAFYDALGIEGP